MADGRDLSVNDPSYRLPRLRLENPEKLKWSKAVHDTTLIGFMSAQGTAALVGNSDNPITVKLKGKSRARCKENYRQKIIHDLSAPPLGFDSVPDEVQAYGNE